MMTGDYVKAPDGTRGWLFARTDGGWLLEHADTDSTSGPYPEDSLTEVTWCEWFAQCQHEATGTVTHPVLGEVPTCDRCRALAEK